MQSWYLLRVEVGDGEPQGVIIIVGVLFKTIIAELVQCKGLPLEALKRAIFAKVVVGNVIIRILGRLSDF